MADEQDMEPEAAPRSAEGSEITFFFWDDTSVTFSAEHGPYSMAVENGIVFLSQGEDETGIPTSSIKYSVEHTPNG